MMAAAGLVTMPAGAASPSASPSSQQAVLRVGWTISPDSLNPMIGYESTDFTVWDLNYDGLVGYDKVDLHPTGDLAESWSVTPDGKTWTFHIRHNVKWQDGVPLTAQDVAFTYELMIKGKLATFASQMQDINEVVATDDYTVVIHCDQTRWPRCSPTGCPSCHSTSGARSRMRRRQAPTPISHLSSARGRSSAWSGSATPT